MDIVCLGLMYYDILVKPISKESIERDHNYVDVIKTSTGGDAFNVASGLAKLGVPTALIGKVGNDRTGKLLIDIAAEKGIDTNHIAISQSYGTGTSVLLIHPDSQRTANVYCGANNDLNEGDIDFERIKEAKILAVGSALSLKGLDGEGLVRVLKRTKELGITTAMDVTGHLSGDSFSIIKSYLPFTDIFMPNYQEASNLTGKKDIEEIASEFINCGARIVIIKMGAEGCFICTKDEALAVPAFKVNAVDTTGAGDSFVAGFLTAYLKGWPLYECGKFGNAVGALCVQEIGASDGVKPFDEVMKFIENYKK